MKRFLCLVLCLLMLLPLVPSAAAEDGPKVFSLAVRVGETVTPVRAYECSYPGNVYLSLSDLSAALSGSAKHYSIQKTYSGGAEVFAIWTGEEAKAPSAAGEISQSRPIAFDLLLKRSRIFLNNNDRRYYTFREGDELYMSVIDVQLMLNLPAVWDGNVLVFYPEESFQPDFDALNAAGYFDEIGSVVIGDLDTGRYLTNIRGSRSLPIASLTKLMSYLLFAEAMEEGGISKEASVTVSENAAALSRSADGMVLLKPGKQVPLKELLDAMMLASSNESCLAIAEALFGSEEACVARMNERAAELMLRSANFYTCHGLPSYTEGTITAKRQNHMNAIDLFRLTRFLVHEHPEIYAITQQYYCSMPTLDYNSANSNPLVFNLPGVNGLKTGSTNRAGYCLVATLPVTCGSETHTICLVLLGAEDPSLRGQAAEILLRWAARHYAESGF